MTTKEQRHAEAVFKETKRHNKVIEEHNKKMGEYMETLVHMLSKAVGAYIFVHEIEEE